MLTVSAAMIEESASPTTPHFNTVTVKMFPLILRIVDTIDMKNGYELVPNAFMTKTPKVFRVIRNRPLIYTVKYIEVSW